MAGRDRRRLAACCRGLLAACGGAAGGRTPSRSPSTAASTCRPPRRWSTAFEKATGITVNIRSDDEDTLADQIVTEGSHSPADVFYTENSPPLESLQAKGLLAKVDASTLSHTPAKYNSPRATGWASRPGSACSSTTRR